MALRNLEFNYHRPSETGNEQRIVQTGRVVEPLRVFIEKLNAMPIDTVRWRQRKPEHDFTWSKKDSDISKLREVDALLTTKLHFDEKTGDFCAVVGVYALLKGTTKYKEIGNEGADPMLTNFSITSSPDPSEYSFEYPIIVIQNRNEPGELFLDGTVFIQKGPQGNSIGIGCGLNSYVLYGKFNSIAHTGKNEIESGFPEYTRCRDIEEALIRACRYINQLCSTQEDRLISILSDTQASVNALKANLAELRPPVSDTPKSAPPSPGGSGG